MKSSEKKPVKKMKKKVVKKKVQSAIAITSSIVDKSTSAQPQSQQPAILQSSEKKPVKKKGFKKKVQKTNTSSIVEKNTSAQPQSQQPAILQSSEKKPVKKKIKKKVVKKKVQNTNNTSSIAEKTDADKSTSAQPQPQPQQPALLQPSEKKPVKKKVIKKEVETDANKSSIVEKSTLAQPQPKQPVVLQSSEKKSVKRKVPKTEVQPNTNTSSIVDKSTSEQTQPQQPPKKKKKFFTNTEKPEIKITKVGSAIHMHKKTVEPFSIYKLYNEMRESNVMSDRWCIPEPMWDPHTNREVLLCYEVDVLMDGSVRMKRCLKILEDFELIVLLDGADKTHLFKEKHPHIRSSQELLDLIRRVTMVKVCSGIKDCDPTDFESLVSKVKARGGSWYSLECNVEVEKGCLGNICKKCTSLRNTLRRKIKRQCGLDTSNGPNSSGTPQANRTLISNSVKPVIKTVGEALYANLQHMSGMNRIIDEDDELPPLRSTEQVFHPELKIYMNSDLKERLEDLAANPPPPQMKIEHVVEFDPRTMTKTLKRIQTPVLPTSFRHLLSGTPNGGGRSAASKRAKADQNQNANSTYVMGSNGELTLVQTPTGDTIQLPEGYILADEANAWGDNVVVQKLADGQEDQLLVGDDNSILVGSNFTLEDGEEYEVIGEAASGEGDSIQVLPLATNSDIEIIEVDENMIQLVDENSQPEIQPVDASSDIFKFLQAQSRLHV